MTQHNDVIPTIKLTRSATTLLAQLRRHYQRELKFRVFPDESAQLAIRLHDKDYQGDWMLDTSDGGLAVARAVFGRTQALAVDCRSSIKNQSGFELILHTDSGTVSTWCGDRVISRLVSAETETCDLYGEYCHDSYEKPVEEGVTQV